ncbi:MAG: flagellar basal-body rod protein FlgG [bacterium]
MMRSLFTAATGMLAEQLNTDNIAHNLANVNTTGYKMMRMSFQDLFYQTMREAGTPVTQGASIPEPLQVGLGTRPVANRKIFTQGNLIQTERDLDLAIEGIGFFQIRLPNGEIAYTRDGTFGMDEEGSVVTSEGYYLEPALSIPAEADRIDITTDGHVTIKIAGQVDPQDIGDIRLVRFINNGGLSNIGENLFLETAASGPPIEGQPGLEGFGLIRQRFLEQSNVLVVNEMVNLIVAQRAFEASSKAIQTSDDMLGVANNLKR